MSWTPPPSGSQLPSRPSLVRPRQGRMVAGVCVGLARWFGVSPTTVRVIFLVSLLLPGPQILAYVAAWVLIPSE